MTSTVNSRAGRVIAAVLLACGTTAAVLAEEPLLRWRATFAAPAAGTLTIELLRWSTDAERTPLRAALAEPPPPARGAGPAAAAGRGGRGGRGGRAAAPPPSQAARMSAAVKAAPTVGFIWGDGPTGYAIKYAWRDAASDTPRRVVLLTDRRLGAHSTSWPQVAEPAADVEFTVLEIRFDANGAGEGKASLTTPIEDTTAQTLALDGYGQAPVLLKVTR